ncbi:ATP-grasp domain-containing protein [Streptomyces sp. NPDC046759]|uniref:ATP-grasp domain-containing protein n=1 Tax=Streptomyces sp. NPDC046759 TaxID=3155019 RepID=UPI00340C336A
MSEFVAIVDGYSSGNFLPPAFARLGVEAVHVQSTPQLIGQLAPPLFDRYRYNIIAADAEAAARELAGLQPKAVLAGAEFGVRFADELGERLGLRTNGTRLSATRRDKYLMIEALRAAGIRCARQHRSSDPEELRAWAEREDVGTVVVKPISSSGSDNVHICGDGEAIVQAARSVMSAADLFQQPNTEVLAQSFLPGPEYVVDVVCCEGERYVCGVWEYDKRDTGSGRRVYDRNILLDPRQEPVPELVDYVGTVLEALAIRNGPAHAEVVMTPSGPALVEIAARLNGGMRPGFHDRCLGTNQATATALAYARPDEFLGQYGGRTYTKLLDAVVHHTTTSLDGIVAGVDQSVVDDITALPTVYEVNVKYRPGRRIRPTVDLPSSPFTVYMASEDAAALEADYKAVNVLKERVYRLA